MNIKIIKKTKNKSGFSLLEMIIAMAISSIIILSVVSVFAAAVKTQNEARINQKKVEAAGAAMEIMAKTIRMSSYLVVSEDKTAVYMYNNSQNKCVSFKLSLSGTLLQMAERDLLSGENPAIHCTAPGYGSPLSIVRNVSGLSFQVTKTNDGSDGNSKVIGKATILIKIGNSNLQTSVSFMGYNGIIQ